DLVDDLVAPVVHVRGELQRLLLELAKVAAAGGERQAETGGETGGERSVRARSHRPSPVLVPEVARGAEPPLGPQTDEVIDLAQGEYVVLRIEPPRAVVADRREVHEVDPR